DDRLKDEMEGRVFLSLSAGEGNLYREPLQGWDDVFGRFPEALDDVEAASKCLAIGQGTATVMHLMRVMELGLKALAKALGIPYAPSWESYLKQIQTQIGKVWTDKTPEWKKEEPFYRDASGDLLSVKQAWRNPSMHVVRKYGPDEALEIYVAVRTFMKRLAL